MKKSIVFVLLLACSIQYSNAQSATKKNILFIAVDDLKPLINAYGQTQMVTPNFDRLAKSGVIFQNAEVQQAVCGPSRACVMTGTYPDRTKVWDLQTDFRESAPELISMPEYLISQGYETTAIGKIFHKGSAAAGHDGKSWSIPHTQPENFDPKYGAPAFGYYQSKETKAQMVSLMKEAEEKGMKKENAQRNYAFKRLKPSTESADVSDEAYQDGIYTVEALKKLQMLASGTKPFFLGVGYQRPHLPFVAPKKYWDLYKRENIKLAANQNLIDGTPDFAYHSFGELRAFTDIDDNLKVGDRVPEDKQKELIHGYMASISYIDAQLGKLLDELDRLKLTNNTIIVLWGDHGYHLGDHTLWNKHSNFEQATRIPFMFSGPGVAKNVKVTSPVELIDVFPTLFDLVNVKQSAQTDGKSLITLLDTNSKNNIKTEIALSQYPRQGNKMGYSIRTERYRYTEWHGNSYNTEKPYDAANIVGVELYDFVSDPLETKNHAKEANYKATAAELQSKLMVKLNEINKRNIYKAHPSTRKGGENEEEGEGTKGAKPKNGKQGNKDKAANEDGFTKKNFEE
ncbi:sulfatase [Flavobacterium nackdongense]|uniref:Sulfatase n=1 Tax=Flavobacterium nackdongense TaxID=2547394 RepID=A0A4P6YDP9_9FLAO|nr:sulfatase [Flavobacterium nackdongense]QBN20448.1 sulfatase [Flavobacterium nackdongense]